MKNLTFKEKRDKLGLTQEDLARKLDISVYSVVNYEREPNEKIMKKLDKLLEAK